MLLDEPPPAGASFRAWIAHPSLRTLYDLWLRSRGERIAMRRADLDPTEIPRLLPNLILSDVGEGGRQIRYRLVGTEIVAAHGFDYTGKTVEQLTSGPTLAYTYELYGLVVSQAVPVYSEGYFRWAGREHRWTKRLHLPLTRTGTAVDMVLAGQVFEPPENAGDELMLPATVEQLAADRAGLGDTRA